MMDYRYNNKITTDVDKQIIEPIIVLCTRSGKKLGAINNVQELKCNHPMNDAAEISFDVYKETDGIITNNWDLIKDFKFVYLPTVKDIKYRWYEIIVNIDEGNDTIKHVTGIHANEAELGQLMLYEVEINTANDIARDDYEIIKIDNKEYGTVFYNPEHPKASLLHRILLDKASHYSILHVDDTLKNLQREFSFNGTSIVDALRQNIAQEIGCLFVFGESDIDDNEYHRTISAYDLMDYCTNCKERGNYTNGVCTHCGSTKIKAGYGHDTGIFINVENLSDSISYSSNTDQVKNFFKLTAGDEDMTAAIRNCNPSGSNYLCYFSDEIKEDMSDELRTKVTQYMNTYDSYLKTKSISLNETYVSDYNNLINKYQSLTTDTLEIFTSTVTGFNQLTDYEYNALTFRGILQTTLMPASEDEAATTAAKQLAKLTTSSMSPIGVDNASAMSLTAADTAVESYAKVYVDTSRYKIELANSSYSNKQWTGTIIITSYTEDTDTAQKNMTLAFNNDAETFTKQKIKKLIKQHKVEDIGDVSFLENPAQAIKDELKKYSLDALSLLDDLCVAVMDILTEAGYAKTSSEYYNTFYKPYFDKRKVIIAEEKVREAEIKTVQKMIDHITNKKKSINNALDLENYFGDLYSELMLYRRDSEYNNSNFISDGMDDSEIIKNAKEYFKRAQEELLKASTPQHTISASLYDLFMIPEFRNIVAAELDDSVQYFIDLFESGNWIRIQVDDKVYKLRLVNWEIDYTKPENLDVEFSDAIYTGSIMSDVSSVLSKARSMATSYDATVRQAEKGTIANQIISETQQYGFVLNKNSSTTSVSTNARPARRTLKSSLNNQNKIINDIDNQNFVIDSQGALMRAKNEFDDSYNPEQIKLLNKGIYYTNDSWETVKAGLGHFSYIDPETGETKEDYGVIASTIVGQLILGNNLKIFSESGKFSMGDGGFAITSVDGDDNTDLFVIQKQKVDDDGRPYVEKYIYVDRDGNVQISGNTVTIDNKPIIEYIDDAIDDVTVSLPITIQIDSSAGNIFKNKNISTILTATVYRGGEDITSQISQFRWTKKDKDGNIDPSWSRSTTSNIITINNNDVTSKAVFGCEVTVEQ